MTTPRIRMFAGPNGSGKSTIKAKVAKQFPRIFGIYINPDDIEQDIREKGRFNFGRFKIKTHQRSQMMASRPLA